MLKVFLVGWVCLGTPNIDQKCVRMASSVVHDDYESCNQYYQLFREEVADTGAALNFSCIEAGYAEGSAHVRASELRNPRKFPLVVKHIDELRSELQEKYRVDYGSHISELAKLRNEAREKGAWSAAINAEVARGKAAGLYIEQKIIKHGKLEDLSERELEARLSEIIDDNKLLLEHEDVDSLKEKVKNPPELKVVQPIEED